MMEDKRSAKGLWVTFIDKKTKKVIAVVAYEDAFELVGILCQLTAMKRGWA